MRKISGFIIVIIGTMAMAFLLPTVASATIHNISIVNFAFSPLNTSISPGDTVRWTNNSISSHTSTSDTRIWSSGVISPGATYSHEFLTPGVFPYQCSIHVAFGMRDTIHVTATGIDERSTLIPQAFELAQNYPNPFNAQTNISFSLYSDGDTKLEIYDLLGQRVAILVDRKLQPGAYSYTWNAGDRVSGVFFYRLSFDGQSQTNRMILLK